jgi:hypothetical protein
MCATAALSDGAAFQTGVDDHRDTVLAQLLGGPMHECTRIVELGTVPADSTTSPAMIVSRPERRKDPLEQPNT